jgi:hypothetical protein
MPKIFNFCVSQLHSDLYSHTIATEKSFIFWVGPQCDPPVTQIDSLCTSMVLLICTYKIL